MIGQKDSANPIGPTIGDFGSMMFIENYGIIQKVQLQNATASTGDDLLLENGYNMIQESPSEGIRISDISTLYPNQFVSGFETGLNNKAKLNYSAVVQTG